MSSYKPVPDVRCPFLHGPIGREAAEAHLVQHADTDGWFLVRRKEGHRNTLVLSVVVAPRVEHHLISLPSYAMGPFEGPFSCLDEMIQCMRLPRSGWHVPLTRPCTRKLVANGEDPVGMASWEVSRPSPPQPNGGWPSDSDGGSRPSSRHHAPAAVAPTSLVWPTSDEEDEVEGLYDTARPHAAVAAAVDAHAAMARLDMSADADEPVYDAQPQAALQRIHGGAGGGGFGGGVVGRGGGGDVVPAADDGTVEPMYATQSVLSGVAVAAPAAHGGYPAHRATYDANPAAALAQSRHAAPQPQQQDTDDYIERQREASRQPQFTRGFAPPPLPQQAEPSYAEVDPDEEGGATGGGVTAAAAPITAPTTYVFQSVGTAANVNAGQLESREQDDAAGVVGQEGAGEADADAADKAASAGTENAAPGGVGRGKMSRISRMFSRKVRKQPAAGEPKVAIAAVDDEASSTTPCTFYGTVDVEAPCGVETVETALHALYFGPYASSARIPGVELTINPQRVTFRDLHGDLLTESPLYAVTYCYTDPDNSPRLFVLITASIAADNRFRCTVVEANGDVDGTVVKRRLDAALTVAQLPIRYDGPDTFAANGK